MWHEDMLLSLHECVTAHRDHVIGVVQLMLNACAEGFKLQRGYIFWFGDYDENSPDLITNHDIEQLLKAPINTIAAEQTLGASNYERKLRGPHQLAKASVSIVKAKSWDLVELKPANEF